jgi:phosphoribosyl-ATP pyrophosphohydrolase
MIIPSIDLMDGQTVQLIGGKEKSLDAGDPRPIAKRFARAGEVAVIDLDAALGKGHNRDLIKELLAIAPCRVGGGIRDLDTARMWLDAGAVKIILGTKAIPEILRELPKDRVMAALDSEDGDIVVEGWQTKTGETIEGRMGELRDLVGGFLVTFVEREGRLKGGDLERAEALVAVSGGVCITFAGGISELEEIAALDRLGADAQVGMALYTERLDLGAAIAAPLTSDRSDGLWPTVVVDELGIALGLAWSDADSLSEAVRSGRGVYHSRSRGLWIKGETSGASQELLRVDLDCDRDAIRFTVAQKDPGFCHLDTMTCWGDHGGVAALARRLARRAQDAPDGSYTRRLLDDPKLLRAKLAEEAAELAAAETPAEVVHEAADLLYFTLTAMARAGVPLADVAGELDRRALKITRRPGNAKET